MQAKVFPEHIDGPQWGRHLAGPFDDVSNPAVIASGAKQSPALGDCRWDGHLARHFRIDRLEACPTIHSSQ
jgi:hypothetical protein